MLPDPGIGHLRGLNDNGQVVMVEAVRILPFRSLPVPSRKGHGVPRFLVLLIGPNGCPDITQAYFKCWLLLVLMTPPFNVPLLAPNGFSGSDG